MMVEKTISQSKQTSLFIFFICTIVRISLK